MNKLYIIGNGFDLEHNLKTQFDPDFKEIAEKNETLPSFWDFYSENESDIWSNFENSIATPNFHTVFEVLYNDYCPDYSSDDETDRDLIISVALNCLNVTKSLDKFAKVANDSLSDAKRNDKYLFNLKDKFLTFNYTHTLEKLYDVSDDNVLHVHGKFGVDELILGYPEGEFNHGKISEYVTERNDSLVDTLNYIDNLEDWYVKYSYEIIYEKSKKLMKTFQVEKMKNFLQCDIFEIEVLGHSCNIDFPYFMELVKMYPDAIWIFNPYSEVDKISISNLIKNTKINNYTINDLIKKI